MWQPDVTDAQQMLQPHYERNFSDQAAQVYRQSRIRRDNGSFHAKHRRAFKEYLSGKILKYGDEKTIKVGTMYV
jgi:hypothetical protein